MNHANITIFWTSFHEEPWRLSDRGRYCHFLYCYFSFDLSQSTSLSPTIPNYDPWRDIVQTWGHLSTISTLGIDLNCKLLLNDQPPGCPGSPTCFCVSLFPQQKKLIFLSTSASMGDLFQNANEEAAEQVQPCQDRVQLTSSLTPRSQIIAEKSYSVYVRSPRPVLPGDS